MHEQKDFRNQEKNVEGQKAGVACSNMGYSKNKTKGQNSSTAKTVETPETESKVIGEANCPNKKRN